jgi:hypothetical protein
MHVAAPTAFSTYRPDPTIGESPTRPGSLKSSPDVEQPTARSPRASSAQQPTVSCPPPGVAGACPPPPALWPVNVGRTSPRRKRA